MRTYWSETRSEKTGSGPSGRARVDQEDLGPLGPHRQVDADAGGQGDRPRPGRQHDVGGTDAAAVRQDDAADPVGGDVDRGHGSVLAQAGPAAAGGRGEGQGGLVPVAEAAVGLVGELGEVVEPGRRPQLMGLVVAHQLDLDAEGAAAWRRWPAAPRGSPGPTPTR